MMVLPISGAVIDFPEIGAERKIVVFAEGVTDAERDEIIASARGTREARFRYALSGDVVTGLNESDLAAVRRDPRVVRVDDDVLVYALRHNSGETVTALAQTLPWGIDRVDAELVWPLGNTGDPVKVGVIDTGISSSHPDLKANLKGGVNTINSRFSSNDDNGHGSHVAGIISAVNDGSGVVGAAPAADLYAIKVLRSNGSGYLSDIIEGIDWAIARGMDVINMSLGTTSNVQSFRDAVIRAYNAGIVIVAAAGNNGGAVNYPGAYPEVIAVSATDASNALASWSSRGPEVDLAAPGVSIYSTYKNKTYATLSGTSMAAPHVAGAAALLLNTPVGSADLNGNGTWDPSEVLARLQATATDLGAAGVDSLYGAGLLNAYAAFQ